MPQQMARLVDTRHKMTHLPVASSTMARLSRSSHMDWRDSKGPYLEKKTFHRIHFSNNDSKGPK
jgi:hypothetical protein